MIGWNFPPNNFGQKDGFNDPGIEHFKGVPYDSVAREAIQNSLDAALKENGAPVEVHFELYEADSSIFPNSHEYCKILQACKAEKPDNEKIQKFFDTAISLIGKEKLPVLKISDFNTTGLLGSHGNGHAGNDWENLIKSTGSSDKGIGKGGSFGIGKNAAFACSRFRAIFYSTLDREGYTAFQGVSKLMTHTNAKDEETRGTGFYGGINKNEPIFDFEKVHPFFHRSQCGTDLFIFGFNESKEWESEIIKSVIENYLVAIHEGQLIAKVGSVMINASKLPELLKTYFEDEQELLAPQFYKSLVSPDTNHFSEDLDGLGKVDLYVFPERNFAKRIAIFRKSGMKIFNKGNFQTPIQFAGVFIARGEKINDFMRQIEPPSHNALEHLRHDNPEYAKSTVKTIYKWINENVKSLARIDESEELDVEGIAAFLPDDMDDFAPEMLESHEGIEDGAPKEVEVKVSELRPPPTDTEKADVAGDEGGLEGSIQDEGKNENQETGGGGTMTPTDIIGGEGNTGTLPDNTGGDMQTPSKKPINLKRVRIFCINSDDGSYRVVFVPDSTGIGHLMLSIIGDDGSEDPAPIESAKFTAGEVIGCNGNGQIGPINFTNGVESTFDVRLKDNLRCAMEVSANAS